MQVKRPVEETAAGAALFDPIMIRSWPSMMTTVSSEREMGLK